MKICVTSVGRDMTSNVDPRFGRAAHFLLIDTKTDQFHCLDDITATGQGAGVMVAQSVIDSGATAVVTGQIGPRAYDVLAAAGIGHRSVSLLESRGVEVRAGVPLLSTSEVVQVWLEGKLEAGGNTCGHGCGGHD